MSKTTMALLGQPVVAALSVTLLFLLCLQVANFKPVSIEPASFILFLTFHMDLYCCES